MQEYNVNFWKSATELSTLVEWLFSTAYVYKFASVVCGVSFWYRTKHMLFHLQPMMDRNKADDLPKLQCGFIDFVCAFVYKVRSSMSISKQNDIWEFIDLHF